MLTNVQRATEIVVLIRTVSTAQEASLVFVAADMPSMKRAYVKVKRLHFVHFYCYSHGKK